MFLNLYVCMFVYESMCINMYIEGKDSIFPPYFLRENPLLNLEPAKSPRAAGQRAAGCLLAQASLHWGC